jgi:cell division protease FtsH
MGHQADYSHEVAQEIDNEVRKLIEAAHDEAWGVLNTYRDVLDDLVLELLDKETLQRSDLARIFTRVEKRPRITAFNDFGSRVPSDKPPVKTRAEMAKERGEPWPERSLNPDPTPVASLPSVTDQPAPGSYAPNGGNSYGSPQPVPYGASGQAGAFGQPNVQPHQGYQGPNGTPNSPNGAQNPTNGVQQGGSNQNPSPGGPPNYGAPPGWTPATTPASQGQSSWQPSWEASGGGGQPADGGEDDQNKKR